MKLSSLNIRKGLELEVPVTDIFAIDMEPFGDRRAMDAHETGWGEFSKSNNIQEIIGEDDGIMYGTKKIKHSVGKTLDAYVYDSYLLYSDPDNGGKVLTDKTVEIEFVNTKMLTLNEFFSNLMEAQAFSGLHEKKRMFRYRFIGVGDFNMHDYIEAHQLASHSNMHLLDFFVFHKKVLSSIGFFIAGLCENDINSQKEYLTDKEYKEVISEAKKQWRAVKKITRKTE